jgi:hypothetical protein
MRVELDTTNSNHSATRPLLLRKPSVFRGIRGSIYAGVLATRLPWEYQANAKPRRCQIDSHNLMLAGRIEY